MALGGPDGARPGPPSCCRGAWGRIQPGTVFQPHGRLDEVPTGYEAMNNREALKVLVRPHRPRRSHWRKHEHHVGTDAAQRLVGDIAPKLAELTDDVLFGTSGRARARPPGPLPVTVAASSRTVARSSSSATCASPGRTA